MEKEALQEIKEILNKPPETEEAVVEEESVDEVVEEAEEEVVAEAAEEAEAVEAEETTETDDTTKTYTVSEFAEAVGWETDDLYSGVMIPMKDGENVSLGDFKNKYQDIAHENTQLQTQLEEAKTGGAQQSQQLSNDMITLAGNLDQVNRVESSTDWDELEQLDPTEAVLKRDKIRRAREEVQQAMLELQGKEDESYKTYLGQQSVKMVELIPEWKDDTARKEGQGAIRGVMQGYGFTDAEINSIIDPRQMKIMNDFAQLKAKAATSLKAVKKVRTAPKVLNSNRTVSKGNPQDAVDKLVKKATRSGDRKLEHQAIKGILEGKV